MLQKFPGARKRQAFAKFDARRTFVCCDVLLAEFAQFHCVGLHTLDENDDSVHLLAPFLARNADDGATRDGRMTG